LSTISQTEIEKVEIKIIDELDRLHLVDACDSEQYISLEEKLRFLQDALRCCIVQETCVGNFDDILETKEREERLTAIANQIKRNDTRNLLRLLLSHCKCLAVHIDDH
jgi:hypothetical protein